MHTLSMFNLGRTPVAKNGNKPGVSNRRAANKTISNTKKL